MARWFWKAALFFKLLTLVNGDETCAPDGSSLLQSVKAQRSIDEFKRFRGTPNETMHKLAHILKVPDGLFPYDVMPECMKDGEVVEPALVTQSMTKKEYDDIVKKVKEVYDGLDKTCGGEHCERADFAGCIVRLAGHDFMDYNPKDKKGGSDGCVDLMDPDNGGLASCLYTGADLGVSIADVYEHFCSTVSLADFIVIAANAMIERTRQNVLDDEPKRGKIDLKSIFRYGRTTAKKCPEAKGILPNPEESCNDVERVFVKNMGLDWKHAAALMGVHTLGRCKPENSGYNGWWSNAGNSNKFNINYYIKMTAEGWVPKKRSEKKHQWNLGGETRKRQDKQGKQMMLNTDMCLVWSNDADGKVDINAATASKYKCHCAWLGPLESPKSWQKYNNGRFCGSTYIPDDFPSWTRQRRVCCRDIYDPYGEDTDCGRPQAPRGRAWGHVKWFMENEDNWLKTFKEAWKKSTENGQSNLHGLK